MMATKDHSRPVAGQTDRAFWREVFVARAGLVFWSDGSRPESDPEAVTRCADFADASVAEYRRRLAWRNTHDL